MKNILLLGTIVLMLLSSCQKDEVEYSAWNRYFELPIEDELQTDENSNYNILNVNNEIFILENDHQDFWLLDIETKELFEKESPPLLYSYYPKNIFVIDNECYVCFYHSDSLILYKYDTYSNKWYPKKGVNIDPETIIGGSLMRSFATQEKAYVLIQWCESGSYPGGVSGPVYYEYYYYQFWCYDTETDEWEKLTNYPNYSNPTFFTLQNRYFMAFGKSNSNIVWEYLPETNEWLERNPFPGTDRYGAVSFINSDRIYCGLGYSNSLKDYVNDFWEYDIINDSWEQVGELKNANSTTSESFVIDSTNYITIKEEIWKFNGWE